MTSKKTSPHRHSGEPHKRGKGRRSFSTAKLVIALQQRSRPSLQPFATATATPASAGITSKKTSPHRHSGEPHKRGKGRRSFSTAKLVIALQQRSRPSLRPFATAIAIPAAAWMTSKKPPHIVIPAKAGIALQRRSHPSFWPFATATAIPGFAGMTDKERCTQPPYGSAWASRLVNMANCRTAAGAPE